MLLDEFKEYILTPQEEIYLNQSFSVKGVDIFLIALTREENRNALWAMFHYPDYPATPSPKQESDTHPLTNRDKMKRGLQSQEQKHFSPRIEELTIQGQKMSFHSSCGNGIHFEEDFVIEHIINQTGGMQLQHFLEHGMDASEWKDFDMENICFMVHEQCPGQPFPVVDPQKDLDLQVKIKYSSLEFYIGKPVRLEFSDQLNTQKQSFFDPINQQEHFFYLTKMRHYDIWEETQRTREEQIRISSELSVPELADDFEYLETICPKGMDMAVLEYEVEDSTKYQLNFYSKKYLDAAPKFSTIGHTHHFMMVFGDMDDSNHMGFRKRASIIMPVEKDCQDGLDTELFSCFVTIPSEVVSLPNSKPVSD